MKRTLIIAFIALLVINIGMFGYIGISSFYKTWGRRLIYAPSSTTTNYPGDGELITHEQAQLFIIPKNGITSFFVPTSDINKYSNDNYTIVNINAQDRVHNAVGISQGWENITGSGDVYLSLYYPSTKLTKKFRVSSTTDGSYQNQSTGLWVENVALRLNPNNSQNEIKPLGYLSNIGKGVLQKLIKKGDALVIIPETSIPILSPVDNNGNYLANEIIIRRVGGITEATQEMK